MNIWCQLRPDVPSPQVSREELLVVLTQTLEMTFLDPVVDCAIIFVRTPPPQPLS